MAIDSIEGEYDLVEQEETAEPEVEVETNEQRVMKLFRWADPNQTINIAEELEPDLLPAIGLKVIEETQIDETSRSGWLERSRAAMDLAMQISKGKTHPWPGASNVIFPLMTEAADQFAARAYPAIVVNRTAAQGAGRVGRGAG
jgi:chaperonin GroES